MDKIRIKIDKNVDISEFKKCLCFVSSSIQNFKIEKDTLELEISENEEMEVLKSKIISIMKKYKKDAFDSNVFFENLIEKDYYFPLENNSDIMFWGNGQVSFSEKGKFLLDYFDGLFYKMAIGLNAQEKFYPALLPLDEYYKTGYIDKTPQYSIFCSSVKDDIDIIEGTGKAVRKSKVKRLLKEPQFALSPSACFHTYIEYKNKTLDHNTIITFRQNVFRNEGRLNYDEIGRLCDYHVREIVMIGSEEYVECCRNELIKKTTDIMKEYKLSGDISLASDSFIMPKMQLYRKIQKIDKSKYEMHLKINKDNEISTASFNLHGKAFTDPFNISVKGNTDTVTACVGFGLQRWVIAFFCQFGFDENNWPESIAKEYKKREEI